MVPADAPVRLDKNTRRTGTIDATLGELLELAAKLNNYRDRRVLADYVAAKIYGA